MPRHGLLFKSSMTRPSSSALSAARAFAPAPVPAPAPVLAPALAAVCPAAGAAAMRGNENAGWAGGCAAPGGGVSGFSVSSSKWEKSISVIRSSGSGDGWSAAGTSAAGGATDVAGVAGAPTGGCAGAAGGTDGVAGEPASACGALAGAAGSIGRSRCSVPLKISLQAPQRTRPPRSLSWSWTTRNVVRQCGQRVASTMAIIGRRRPWRPRPALPSLRARPRRSGRCTAHRRR